LYLDEINLTTRLLQSSDKFQSYMRIITIIPNEPEDKNYVLNYKPNDPLQRCATATVRDPKGRTTYLVVVDLIKKSIESFTEFNQVQPALTFDEMIEADDALRSSEAMLAAFAKRNINIDNVVFYPFSSGYRDERDHPSKRRIFRPHAAVRKWKEDNYYAHHVEGLVITVDLDSFTVDVEDHIVVPLAPKSANYDPEGIKSPDNVPYFPDGVRKDLKPLIITQPEGPSFQIDGYQITWQKWRFRVGFNVREGNKDFVFLMNSIEKYFLFRRSYIEYSRIFRSKSLEIDLISSCYR
jgi:primary-amine oxidase